MWILNLGVHVDIGKHDISYMYTWTVFVCTHRCTYIENILVYTSVHVSHCTSGHNMCVYIWKLFKFADVITYKCMLYIFMDCIRKTTWACSSRKPSSSWNQKQGMTRFIYIWIVVHVNSVFVCTYHVHINHLFFHVFLTNDIFVILTSSSPKSIRVFCNFLLWPPAIILTWIISFFHFSCLLYL